MANRRISKLVWEIFGLVLMTASIVLLVVSIASSNDSLRVSRENQGYTRYIACVIEVRNAAAVVGIGRRASDACWDAAEKEVGIKLKRYSEMELMNETGN